MSLHATNLKSKLSIGGSMAQVITGALFALAVSFIGVFIVAMLIRSNPFMEDKILIISQSVKYLSAGAASVIACMKRSEKGFMRGMTASVLYIILGFLLYGIMGRGFSLNAMFFLDLLICAIIGMLIGSVMVNSYSKKHP